MKDGDFGGGNELGSARSAFRAKPTRQSARLNLLAWADSNMCSSASAASADLLRKFAQDQVYCEAYADAEIARAREDWSGVAIAVAKFQAAGDRVSNANKG